MKQTRSHTVLSYLVAVACVGLTFAVRDAIDPILGERQPYVLFYFAVAIAAWFGGLWPGLFAAAMSYLLATWSFVSPHYDLRFSARELVGAGIFLLVSSVIAGLTQLLRRAEQRTRQSAARLRGVIASATDAIITIDADQKITLFNEAAERMFGYSASEMLGKPLDQLMPERFRDVHRRHVTQFGLASGIARQMGSERVLAGLRRNGEEFPLEAHISQAIVGEHHLYTVIIRDITERKGAEAEREKLLASMEHARIDAESATDRMHRMQRVTEALLADLPLDDLLREVLVRVRDTLATDVAVIVVRSPEDEEEEEAVLRVRAASGFEETLDENFRIRIGEYFAGRVAQERRPLTWNNPDSELIWPVLRRKGVRALAGVPLLSDGRLFGVLHVGSVTPRDFSADEVELLRLAGERIVVGIERAARRDAEQREREVLETSNRTKDEFLAMLGHELRNPLSAVRNAVVTASLDESQRSRALEIARRQTDQLGRLIDDLLDVARITQGRIILRKERVHLADVVQRAVESVRSFIEEHGVHLSVSLPRDSLRIEADQARVEQVLVNLLTNAGKYTDRGGQIDVTAERRDSHCVVRVRDTGCGIAPELLPRIWDLFTQADRSLDRAQGGLGIGLTVARRLVELHGGEIDAHSEGAGKGAEFVIGFPLLTGPAEDVRTVTAARPKLERQARVLLVEDNRDAAESLSMLLELFGHEVHTVYDGATALDDVRARVPDIMLVDIGLPGIDGYEVARRVRRDATLSNVVLVALTGYGRLEDKQTALAAGFDYHLVKPVTPEGFADVVSRLPQPN